MPEVKIPQEVKAWFQSRGIDKLDDFLEFPSRLLMVLPLALHGELKLVSLDNTADNTQSISLRPPSGKKWLIIEAFGYHDDTSSRTVTWAWTDDFTTLSHRGTGQAAQVRITFDCIDPGILTINSVHDPWITYKIYLKLTVASLGSGKYAYVNAVVVEVDE